MDANTYQKMAARTINPNISSIGQVDHALKGMVSEIGEINGIYQKVYQGHAIDYKHLKKELGDLLWFIAEYCTALGWDLGDIMQMNIEKLKDRYPEGFTTERSLNRVAGDI